MSLKIDMMVNHLRENNKDYKIMSKKTLIAYTRDMFRCSPYMAKRAVEILLNNE
jgi:hypothetical protein